MDNTNIEIIKRLYDNGSITFEEAMKLGMSAKDTNDAENTKVVDDKQIHIAQFISNVIDDTNDDGEILPGINIDFCYDVMHTLEWEMRDDQGNLVSVTPKMVKDNAIYVCKCAIESLIRNYKQFINGEVDETALEASCSTGAFQASAYIEDGEETKENPLVCLDLEFIPKSSFAVYDINKLL